MFAAEGGGPEILQLRERDQDQDQSQHLLAMATTRFPGKSVDVAANWTAPALGRPVCVNGTPWILYLLEECVDNVWEYCSVVIGLISMFCFLLSTLP